MKNWFLCVLAICLVGVVNSTADAAKGKGKKPKQNPAETFKKFDKDGNGSVTVREYTADLKGKKQESATVAFNKYDKNADGSLTPDEFEQPEKNPSKKKNKKKNA